jgi:two-component system sensor histidine kinase/response regulator
LPRSLNGLRVLVVHDNAAARMLIGRTLRTWSGRPTEVASLAEALSASAGATYDAVVVDEELIARAASLWKEVRGRQGQGLRTVRLLSFVSLGANTAAAASPFDTELTKPLRIAELYRVLTGSGNGSASLTERTIAAKTPAGMLPPLTGRILIVEDQPLNREVAIGMLTSLGLEVETAHHGQQALDILQMRSFDAILMDCEMPVMDGFSATKALRRREQAGIHVPIIALTADVTSAGRAACLAAGMDDHLAKPFRREALHAILSRWLGSHPVHSPVSLTSLAPLNEPTLDGATLDALRALPKRGPKDMLMHIGELYLADSRALIASIDQSLSAGNAADLARAAHAWRSYNGNVGAHGLARLCRDLEDAGRAGNFAAAGQIYIQIQALHAQVRDELQIEMRKSA